MREDLIREIEKEKIIVILRGYTCGELHKILDALYRGGIRFAEVTFNAEGDPSDEVVAENIASLKKAFQGKMHVGAGTVLTQKQLGLAHAAGAEFIISPAVDAEIIARTVELGLVSIPGAFTPTEALAAKRAGADFVKLFPAGEIAPSYIKAISAPLSHIRFLAVAGINFDNVTSYVKSGVCGIGVGNVIVKPEKVHAGDYESIVENARKMVDLVK